MNWSKESRQSRGYGPAWDKVRKAVMVRDGGLCQVCLKAGRYGVIAKAVDHIISKAKAKTLRWTDVQTEHPSNLQAICDPCHAAKTEEEQGKRKRAKMVPGPDGWPVQG